MGVCELKGRKGGRAFTLIELLVVTAILVLLLGLLGPALAGAWDFYAQTKCATNLARIWSAHNTWRADTDFATLTGKRAWRVLLGPYVENVESIFRCPAATSREGSFSLPASDLLFKMYAQVHWSDPTSPVVVVPGEYLGAMVVDEAGRAVKVTDLGGGKYEVGIEDSFAMGRTGVPGRWYDDIRFYMWVENGSPTKVEVMGGDQSTGESYELFRYDFYVGGELKLEDFVGNPGKVIDLAGTYVLCDYGLSNGCYEVVGRALGDLDANLYFIMDYPKPLADYNRDHTDDDWDKHFILSPGDWERKYANAVGEGETWRHYQSLRHSGRANVLFCDGHVETLAPWLDATPDELIDGRYLDETSPLWRRE